METEKGQGANEHVNGGMESLELLDLLFDQQDGILFHEYSPHESLWTTLEQNISAQDNEAFLSSLLKSSDCFTDSNLWSPAASDSGISDTNSDNMNSPPQNPEELNYKYVCKPSVSITMREHAETDMWTGVPYNENNFKPQSWMPDTPITVKDLLLSSNLDMEFSLPHNNSNAGNCEELVLTEDERKLLSKEGIVLSTQLPLTKNEERVLKKVRRKIRNKHSAQESRKKKKEYMDGLESRVSDCVVQNHELQRKVQELEKHNRSLLEQLRKLQALVSQSAGKATRTSTCVAVLLLSFVLIIFPSMNKLARNENQENNDFLPVRVFSRSLHYSASSRVFYIPYESEDNAHCEEPGSQAHSSQLQSRSNSLDMILPSQAQQFNVEKSLQSKNQSGPLYDVNTFKMENITAELLTGFNFVPIKYQILKWMLWNKSFEQVVGVLD